ncbi:cytokine receptor common subunit gamma isoform 1 precursor [Gallus gallus]|uniref:Putative common cytokine receptor gamma chain b n=1 Tax=Gallus gallus TaxID=9031 RepID=Q8AV07_CHICK|nr:cytokine receptor common subunit gamma isoform 1 precursor [Gallus gallus]CAD12041.1 putative common cytokine receptor gamma chain b [Gallus gallus]|eukprot:NP_989858.1 cytokine receptor common subunit gamma isoform 1 precursor [Gallus gallus]
MAVPGASLVPILLLGLGTCLAASPSPKGVECILFNEEYMTCTWGSGQTLTANYSLYYWYENKLPVVECQQYLWDRSVRIGCRFEQSEIIQFQAFYVRVNASCNGQTLEIPSNRMELQNLVKPEAPVNLTIHNMSGNQLQLTWSSPYPKEQCLEHVVKYKSNKDTSWTNQEVKGVIFSFPSVDYEKYYTFYVRSKINNYCGNTQLWSEWSVPVFWGNNSTSKGSSGPERPRSPRRPRSVLTVSPRLVAGVAEEQLQWFWIHTVLIPIASCLLLLVLVVLLVRMERVWVIIMPRIPNPSKNFDDLFITHNGDFQEWVGVPKDVVESFKPNYSESICHVSELPSKEGYERLQDNGTHLPGVPGQQEHGPYKSSYVGA